MKVVRLPALRTGRLYPQKIFQVLISVRGWVDLWAIVRPEWLYQRKFPMKLSGLEPATFRLVEKCLKYLRYDVINCTRGKKFLVFVQSKYILPCSQGLPIASVLRSMSEGHSLTSHTFKIHINIYAFFLQMVSSLRVFQLNVCGLISYVMRATFWPISSSIQPCLDPVFIG
jgi:hypothetical protein